jgi:predicted secreted Zn-dependent protease
MRLFRHNYMKFALAGMLIFGVIGLCSCLNKSTMTVEAITSTASISPLNKNANSNNPAKAAGSNVAIGSPKSNGALVCQPGGLIGPATPRAESSNPGLHQTIQTPNYYTVYGNSIDGINAQMADCTPISSDGDSFAASTDYSLNWAFDFDDDGSGNCHITKVSVAINIALTYPRWQQSSGAAAGLPAAWQHYATNLATHENGHVSIDQAGAARLLSDLQNFPPTNCDTIVTAATYKANNDIQVLNQANDDYDAATNHGAAQGATLR